MAAAKKKAKKPRKSAAAGSDSPPLAVTEVGASAGKAKKPKKPKKPKPPKKPKEPKPAKKPKKPAKPKGHGGIQYGVLRGTIEGGERETDPNTPHCQIRLRAAGETWRVPVNVQSADGSEVLFYADPDVLAQTASLAKLWKAKVKQLQALPEGWTALPDHEPGVALDYVREKYVDKSEMTHLPFHGPGANDDVQDVVELYVERAVEQGATAFAFGEKFPGGVHDIHMNQGNKGKWKKDNGIYQDGAVILLFPSGRHVALLFAFQTQSWNTDGKGHPK